MTFRIGMLWFDNDSKLTLNQKVERAASYYRNKYARIPNICFVHPTMIADILPAGMDRLTCFTAGGFILELVANRSVLPNHYWIGVKD